MAYLYMTLLIVSAPRLENENKNVTWKMLFSSYRSASCVLFLILVHVVAMVILKCVVPA